MSQIEYLESKVTELAQLNRQLSNQLSEITNSKGFKIWQKFSKLKNKFFPRKKGSKHSTYEYYDKHTFWNDHVLVKDYINKLATGSKDIDWSKDIASYFTNKKVKALSIASGNGWQDRLLADLIDFKVLDGYDYSEKLVEEAQNKGGKNFNYTQADLNNFSDYKQNYYDLAINVAGLHHIDNMEKVVKGVHGALKKGGLFVHFDYIGPKRNQYSESDLKYMNEAQKLFPKELVGRNPITKPDLVTMLIEDPSEAVGSEEIIPVLKKYFKIKKLNYLNGGLLYQVLYDKVQNFDVKNDLHNNLLTNALKLEEKLTKEGKIRPLFAYIVAQK